jgi:hypothetical protein
MTESIEATGDFVGQLNKLKRKSDLQTTAHAVLHDRFQFFHSSLTLFSILAGVTLVALVLVPSAYIHEATSLSVQSYQVLLACLAIANLSIVVVILAWRFDVRAAQHEVAVRHYTTVSYEISNALLKPEDVTSTRVDEIQRRYLDTTNIPRIPEDRFLRLKQAHLRKVAMSKELDDHPMESLRSIRRRLSLKESQLTNEEDRVS